MPSLRELQTQFLDALLAASSDTATPLIRAEGVTPEARLRIYRNNVRSNFLEALRSTYPAIRRLVGEAYFHQTVRAFQADHPARSGDLNDAGELFPGYLRDLHPNGEFHYLPDVARLEWLVQEALLAQDHQPLDLQSLARVDPADYDVLRFTLHSTLRLFQSEFPVLRIWAANTADSDPPIIDLYSGGERVAVMRLDGQLCMHRLACGEYEFLQFLAEGASVTAAFDRAVAADPGFDATLALRRFVAANTIVDFAIPDTRLRSHVHS